ncbi:MAG: ATP-binding protein [Sphingobacterium sp.]|nr:ATP-binding protein [Sphingobacterium sp.]
MVRQNHRLLAATRTGPQAHRYRARRQGNAQASAGLDPQEHRDRREDQGGVRGRRSRPDPGPAGPDEPGQQRRPRYARAGGTLEIGLSETVLKAGTGLPFPDIKPGAYILLSVKDSGQGIPPEIMPRIFEPFFTTKNKGKGPEWAWPWRMVSSRATAGRSP